MKLSQNCTKNIEHLARSIENLVSERPNQKSHLNGYFARYSDDLKTMRHCELDLDFIDDLAKIGYASVEDLVRLVDDRPSNDSDYILDQIEDALQNRGRGWSDGQIINRQIELLKTKPTNAVELMNRTLKGCNEKISTLKGLIDMAINASDEQERRQIKFRYGISL